MKKNIFLFLLLGITIFSLGIEAKATPKYFKDGGGKKVAPDPIYKKTIIIPAGYIISVTTQDSINTENLSVADKVITSLNSDFYYRKKLIAPEGSSVIGTVVKSKKADENNDAEIKIKFTTIITPENKNIPISGLTNTKDGIIYGVEGINQNSEIDIIFMQPVTYVPIK